MKTFIAPQYKTLFRCLFLWLPCVNWLWAIGATISVVAIPIYFIWGNPVGWFIGVGILCIGFINVAGLPSQMLSLGSSKQISMLPGVRKASLLIFLFVALCASLVITALVYFRRNGAIPETFLMVSTLVSVLLISAVVLGQKYPRGQGLIFLSLWLLNPVYKFLVNIHWALLLIFCLSIWVVFAWRWLNWRPEKFQPNIFGMSHDQIRALNEQNSAQIQAVIRWRDRIIQNRGETLVGSLLLGRADGTRSRLVSFTCIFLMLSLLVVVFIVLSGADKFKTSFLTVGQINIGICYICIAYGQNVNFFRNLHGGWLYFDGCRKKYFLFAEKSFFRNLFPVTASVLILHIILVYYLLDWRLYFNLVWVMAVYSFIVTSLMFYVSLLIYCKKNGNFNWYMWINNGLMLLAAVPLIACSVLWIEQKRQIMELAIGFFIVAALTIPFFRHWVMQKWLSGDLVRIKS